MKYVLITFLIFSFYCSFSQVNVEISDMKWEADFNIHITFSNDSTIIQDVKALYHVNENPGTKKEFTYYPVALDPAFINNLKNKNLDSTDKNQKKNKQDSTKIKTLWGALHPIIGGGYIHFINSLVYAIESNKLDLKAPLMKRPESKWKPKPMTESYKRTKNWDFFIPHNQKLAIKEYKKLKKKNELGDINILPDNFIELFVNTNDKNYEILKQNKKFNKLAIIDMMRLLVGSKYLGVEQIDFIQGAVIKSIMQYNINNLPSVIVFDNYNAAVAMTLDEEGYKIDKVVFDKEQNLHPEETNKRLKKMELVINEINEVNKQVFEKKLKSYYTN